MTLNMWHVCLNNQGRIQEFVCEGGVNLLLHSRGEGRGGLNSIFKLISQEGDNIFDVLSRFFI